MNHTRRVLGRPWFIGVLVAGLTAVAAGLYWFQLWQLWVDETVQEARPLPASEPPPAGLASGTLISHEHRTTGTVRILRVAGGSLVLRLENLETSSGPDVHVWLTDAPVEPGEDGWTVFDDGKHLDVGELKGNKGNQNYPLPAGAGLAGYTSVSLWCDRFDVSFGAAELTGG